MPNDFFRFDIRFPGLGHRDFEVYIYFPEAVKGGISIGFMNLFSNSNNDIFVYPNEKITSHPHMFFAEDDSPSISIRLDQDFLKGMLEYDTMVLSYYLEAIPSLNYDGYDDFLVPLGGFQERFYETIPVYQKLMEEEEVNIIIDESLYKKKNGAY